MKPLFFISGKIIVTQVRHEFKVEKSPYDVVDDMNSKAKLHIGMRFLLPTAKAIIAINLEYFGFSSFT
jgi:hypothetical protein